MIQSFSVEETARLAGVSMNQLRYWDRTDFLKPSLQLSEGEAAAYSFADVLTLRTARKMLDAGITSRKIRKVIAALNQLRPDLEWPLASLALITDGESVFIPTDDPDIMISVLPPGQLTWKLPLGKIAAEIEQTVQEAMG